MLEVKISIFNEIFINPPKFINPDINDKIILNDKYLYIKNELNEIKLKVFVNEELRNILKNEFEEIFYIYLYKNNFNYYIKKNIEVIS